jgi:hypothetical protein
LLLNESYWFMYGIVHYVYVTIHSSIHQLLECLQNDPKDAGSDQPNFKKKPLEKTKKKERKKGMSRPPPPP